MIILRIIDKLLLNYFNLHRKNFSTFSNFFLFFIKFQVCRLNWYFSRERFNSRTVSVQVFSPINFRSALFNYFKFLLLRIFFLRICMDFFFHSQKLHTRPTPLALSLYMWIAQKKSEDAAFADVAFLFVSQQHKKINKNVFFSTVFFINQNAARWRNMPTCIQCTMQTALLVHF